MSDVVLKVVLLDIQPVDHENENDLDICLVDP
jgi:hypothetical protein